MRKSGRSLYFADLLPKDGCVIITSNVAEQYHVQEDIVCRRGNDFLKLIDFVIISNEDDIVKLAGLSKKVYIDPYFFDSNKHKDKLLYEELYSFLGLYHKNINSKEGE